MKFPIVFAGKGMVLNAESGYSPQYAHLVYFVTKETELQNKNRVNAMLVKILGDRNSYINSVQKNRGPLSLRVDGAYYFNVVSNYNNLINIEYEQKVNGKKEVINDRDFEFFVDSLAPSENRVFVRCRNDGTVRFPSCTLFQSYVDGDVQLGVELNFAKEHLLKWRHLVTASNAFLHCAVRG